MKFSAALVFLTAPSSAFQSPQPLTTNFGASSLFSDGPSKMMDSLFGNAVDAPVVRPESFAPFESTSTLMSAAAAADPYATLPDLTGGATTLPEVVSTSSKPIADTLARGIQFPSGGIQFPKGADLSVMVNAASSAAGTKLTDAGFEFRDAPLEIGGVRNVAPEIAKLPVFPYEKFAASMGTLWDIIMHSDLPRYPAFGDIVRAMDLENLGLWYIGAFGIITLIGNARDMGKETLYESFGATVTKKPEQELPKSASMILVEKKLAELTETTTTVIQELAELKQEKGDREAEISAMKIELKTMQDQIQESKLLEEKLELELSRATELTKTQAKQLTELENEKKQLIRELNAKTKEADQLKARLEKAIQKEEARKVKEAAKNPRAIEIAKKKQEAEERRAAVRAANEKAKKEREARLKQIAEEKEARRVAEKEALEAKKRAIKEGAEKRKQAIEAKRAAAAAAVEARKLAYEQAAAARKAEAAHKRAAAREAAEARKAEFAAKKAAAAEEVNRKAAEKKAKATEAAEARKAAAAAKKAAAKKAFATAADLEKGVAPAPAPAKKKVEIVAPVEVEESTVETEKSEYNVTDSFFATPADLGSEEAEPAAKKKKAAPKKKEATAAAADEDDLRNLSPSALKRKTVKDLVAYLEAKGAPVTGSDGKPMRKAELLESVLSSK